jgi:hypothetical protein
VLVRFSSLHDRLSVVLFFVIHLSLPLPARVPIGRRLTGHRCSLRVVATRGGRRAPVLPWKEQTSRLPEICELDDSFLAAPKSFGQESGNTSVPGPQQKLAATQRCFSCQGVSRPSADATGRAIRPQRWSNTSAMDGCEPLRSLVRTASLVSSTFRLSPSQDSPVTRSVASLAYVPRIGRHCEPCEARRSNLGPICGRSGLLRRCAPRNDGQ